VLDLIRSVRENIRKFVEEGNRSAGLYSARHEIPELLAWAEAQCGKMLVDAIADDLLELKEIEDTLYNCPRH